MKRNFPRYQGRKNELKGREQESHTEENHGCCPIASVCIGPLIETSLLGIPPPPHLMIIISAHHHDHYHTTLFTQNVVWRASLLCPILMMLRSLQTSEHIKQSMIDQP